MQQSLLNIRHFILMILFQNRIKTEKSYLNFMLNFLSAQIRETNKQRINKNDVLFCLEKNKEKKEELDKDRKNIKLKKEKTRWIEKKHNKN